jgi:hypothetical protein
MFVVSDSLSCGEGGTCAGRGFPQVETLPAGGDLTNKQVIAIVLLVVLLI